MYGSNSARARSERGHASRMSTTNDTSKARPIRTSRTTICDYSQRLGRNFSFTSIDLELSSLSLSLSETAAIGSIYSPLKELRARTQLSKLADIFKPLPLSSFRQSPCHPGGLFPSSLFYLRHSFTSTAPVTPFDISLLLSRPSRWSIFDSFWVI